MKQSVSALLIFAVAIFVAGCRERNPPRETPATPAPADARALFEATTKDYHLPSAAARTPERERLQEEAARRYAELVKKFPGESNLCAQALRSIGNIRAAQTNIDAAVRHYGQIGREYPSERWELLQAWKSAADLLWENGRRDEAKRFYADITNRFANPEEPAIIRTVVRGSVTRLRE
jgi:hypothetical protein